MRQTIIIALLFLLVLSPAFAFHEGDEHYVVSSAAEVGYPPFSFENEQGEADGFAVELLRAALAAVDYNVSFYTGPWFEVKEDLAEGRIEALPLVGRTPEREPIYDFTVPYITLYGDVFVRQDDVRIQDLDDLVDKKLLEMRGDNAEEFVRRNNIGASIIVTNTFEEAFRLLAEGKGDAIVMQRMVGLQLIKEHNIQGVQALGLRIDGLKQDFTFAVQEGNDKLLAHLNDGLSRVINDGTYDTLYKKWILPSTEVSAPEQTESAGLSITAKNAIKQRAETIGRQITIYLEQNPEKTLADLREDPVFISLAIQPVGQSGYSFVYDYENMINLFHAKENFVGINYTAVKDEPGRDAWWRVTGPTHDGISIGGTYSWKDPDGVFRDKYKYTQILEVRTGDGVALAVGASTYLDEYRQEIIQQNLAEEAIKERAESVAKQIEIYLTLNPEKTIADLQADPYFQEIAVQQVGQTGYTAVTDYDSLICRFHKNPKIVNMDLSSLQDSLPGFWQIMSQTRGGHEAEGRYDWLEEDGSTKEKYMYIALVNKKTADGVGLHVAATTYLDEYEGRSFVQKTPSIFANEAIRQRAYDIAKQVELYLLAHPEETLAELKEDSAFQELAVQQVGKTGYTYIINHDTGILDFHPDPDIRGSSYNTFKEEFPAIWNIIDKTMRADPCEDSSGFYKWRDIKDNLRDQYTYHTCIKQKTADGYTLFLGASTYLDEYDSEPSTAQEFMNVGQKTIRQKAIDVAKQVEIYLKEYPDKTLEDLQKDPAFQEIAVQQVGKTGYTTITDLDTSEQYFSQQEDMVGLKLSDFKEEMPALWDFFENNFLGRCSQGGTFYNWPDESGALREKYTYGVCVPVSTADGKRLGIDASTYPDEFDDYGVKEERQERDVLPLLFWIVVFVIGMLALNRAGILKIERNLIMLLLGLALLSILILFVINTTLMASQMREDAISASEEKLNLALTAQEKFISTYFEEQTEKIEIIALNKEITREKLLEVKEKDDEFFEIFVLDAKGITRFSTEETHKGYDDSAEDFYVEGRFSTYIGPVTFYEETGTYAFTIATPYKQGVLVARVDPAEFASKFTDVGSLGSSAESVLAYRNKEGDAEFFTQRKFSNATENIIKKEQRNIPITQALLGNENFFVDYVDYRSVPVIAITHYIDELDVGLVTKIDKEEALANSNNTIKEIWVFTIGILISIFIIGMLMNAFLTRSLHEDVDKKTHEIQEINKNLEKTVEKRTQELKKLNVSLEKKVDRRTKEMQNTVDELETFNKLSVGRELKMIELKKEIKELKKQLKKVDKHE